MRAALLVALVGLAGASSAAHAEGERALSVSVGYATFSVPGKAMPNMEPPALSPDWGTALAVEYERMVGSDFGLRAELAGGYFRGGNEMKQSAGSYALLADAGVVFRFDNTRFVPYAFGGVGAVLAGGGPIDRGVDLVLSVGGGLDVLRSRSRSYGIELRVASFGGDITVVTAGLRGTTRWGFFN